MFNLLEPIDDFSYLLDNLGKDIQINNIPTKALITNTNLNESNDNKKITTLTNIQRGFLVDYDNQKWLITSEVNGMRYDKYKGIMQKCNNFIIVNIAGILYYVPCIVTDGASLNIDTNQYLMTLDTTIYILVANDSINSNIKVNDIFKIGTYNYKVVNIDDISQSGLLILKMEFTAEEQVLPNYSISITNTEPLTTNINTPVQLTIEQKDGTTVLTENLPMIFTSSDETICTVDSNGLVTPVSIGNVNITVKLEFDANVNDSISITIEDVPETITYSISGASEITNGYSVNYIAEKLINGTADPNAVFSFSIDYLENSSSIATLTIVSDTECSIKANAAIYYITLVAQDTSTLAIVKKENIKLKNLF